MFTLRIIEKTRVDEHSRFDEVVENFELGSSYSVITKDKTNEFHEIIADDFPGENMKENIESIDSIICGENGDHYWIQCNTPERDYSYFIMTESGKTFERL